MMENIPLHAQKVTILSRLIKESSLTLEEALLLLKEEEEETEPVITSPSYLPGTTTPWTIPVSPYGSGISTGTITWSGSGSGTTTIPANSFFTAKTEAETDLNN
jgi:hypothetical protein